MSVCMGRGRQRRGQLVLSHNAARRSGVLLRQSFGPKGVDHLAAHLQDDANVVLSGLVLEQGRSSGVLEDL